MSFALGFVYFYVTGGLICAMWLLKEMRKQNELHDKKHEDSAMAGAAILIATFWLPIVLFFLLMVICVFCYDALTSLWA